MKCMLIPLAEQDRSLWDRNLLTEGVGLISTAPTRGAVGEYQLQAAIAEREYLTTCAARHRATAARQPSVE